MLENFKSCLFSKNNYLKYKKIVLIITFISMINFQIWEKCFKRFASSQKWTRITWERHNTQSN